MVWEKITITSIVTVIISFFVGGILKDAFIQVLCDPTLQNTAVDSCGMGWLIFYIVPGIVTFVGIFIFISKYL